MKRNTVTLMAVANLGRSYRRIAIGIEPGIGPVYRVKGFCRILLKFSSDTVFPLTGNLSSLNIPFNPGPILLAVLAVRWQAEQFC